MGRSQFVPFFKQHRDGMYISMGPLSSLEFLIRENPNKSLCVHYGGDPLISLGLGVGNHGWFVEFSRVLCWLFTLTGDRYFANLHELFISECGLPSIPPVSVMFDRLREINTRYGENLLREHIDPLVCSVPFSNGFSFEIVKKERSFNWCWSWLSASPSVTMRDIEENPEFPWVWDNVSINPNITFEFIRKHKDKLLWDKLIVNNFWAQNLLNLLKFRFPTFPGELNRLLLQFIGPVKAKTQTNNYKMFKSCNKEVRKAGPQ